ncbi:hypothetical protein Rs2_26626 [Raphanus sativus]|nr:hypothetical protein Rs2_26626 [Raphanus sativus]
MVSVLLATIVLQAGFNPPLAGASDAIKMLFQYSLWTATLFTLKAMYIVVIITPISCEMESKTLSTTHFCMAVATFSIMVAFCTATAALSKTLCSCLVGGCLVLLAIMKFLS